MDLNDALVVIVAVFFSLHAFFNAMAIIARTSASVVGRNAFGASIEKIMSTLKRLMIFFYPPALGYFVIKNDLDSMLSAIALSYVCAFLVQALIIIKRRAFLSYFCAVAENFAAGNNIFTSFCKRSLLTSPEKEVLISQFPPIFERSTKSSSFMKFKRIVLMASWVYFVFGASIFVLNILAIIYSDFAPIILQFLGLFNGLGTIILAFFVDPIISRYLDSAEELNGVTLALLFSQLISYMIIAPLFYFALLQAFGFYGLM